MNNALAQLAPLTTFTGTTVHGINGWSIRIHDDMPLGAIRTQGDELPWSVSAEYCAYCARSDNSASRDGEVWCDHKEALVRALAGFSDEQIDAILNDDDAAADWHDYQAERAATMRGVA